MRKSRAEVLIGGFVVVLSVACLVLSPAPAAAQNDAGIAGTVTDSTAGALPGTVVTVASPALIEQRRTVITDGQGNYRFINLPAGTYSVTFALDGFTTLVREGIVLEGTFVANVDAELQLGTLNENVVVSGEAPLVDVIQTRRQMVMTAELVNATPASSSIMTGMRYVPGVTGDFLDGESNGPTVHGSDGPDSQSHIDGIETGTQLGSRSQFVGGVGLVTDEAAVAEIIYDTSGQSAEFPTSGVRTNMIPKSGGNTFSGDIFADGGHENFAWSNLTPELEEQGFQHAPQAWTWSINPSFGGPIARDKLWFFGSFLYSKNKSFRNDIFFDPEEPSTPDDIGDDLRAFGISQSGVQNGRITWQINGPNRLTSSFTNQQNNFGRVVGTGFGRVAAEALFDGTSDPNYLSTTRWTAAFSTRMLLEATFAYQRLDLNFTDFPENGIGRVPMNDVVSGLQSSTSILQDFYTESHRRNLNVALSYVTGSHNFKTGFQYANNLQYSRWKNNGDIFQALVAGGFPIGVLVMANGDVEDVARQNCDCGFFVQDAWTLDRMTINLGLRYDYFNNSVGANERPAGFFSPAIVTEGDDGLPIWHDWSPRFGFAYDLFGDARTALKATAGRYVANEALGFTTMFSPIGLQADFRTWTDLNFDGTVINPDGVPQFEEIGQSFNPNFGTPTTANRLDPDVQRLSNWEYSAGVEHQLSPGWSLSGKWHYRRFGDFNYGDNTNVSASDFRAVDFVSPEGPLLTNSGEVLQVYEFADPEFVLNTGDILFRPAPDDWRSWNGLEFILDGRLWRGGFGQVSWTTGQSKQSFCTGARDDSPNGDPADGNYGLRFCENEGAFRNTFKISGGVPLPWDTMISGLWQIFPGNEVLGNYNVDQTDLGRPPQDSGGDGLLPIPLIQPGTEYEDSLTRLDLRFAKVFTTGNVRTRVFMDAQNLFNTVSIFSRNRFWGSGTTGMNDEFFRPISLNQGRVLGFGMQTSF